MKLTTSVLAVSLCLLIAFVLAGCDTTAIAPTGEAPESTDPATETVTFDLMKSGDTLEDPSQFTEDVESAKHNGRTSAYGCYLAVRDDEAPQGWRFQSVYLHYPRSVIRAAKGKRVNLVHRLVDESVTDEWELEGRGRMLRLANCYVPDTDQGRQLLDELLQAPAARAQAKQATAKGVCELKYRACVRDSETGKLKSCHETYSCGGSSGSGSGSDAGDGSDAGSGGSSNPFPSSGSGGGDGADDSGGTNNEECGTEIPEPNSSCAPGPRITAEAMRSIIEETCNMTLNDDSANHRFGWSAARSLGFIPTGPKEQAVADGYIKGATLVDHATGETEFYSDLIAGSLEAKNTNDNPLSNRTQAEREINKLYNARQTAHQRARARGWTNYEVGSPTFVVVTTSLEDRLNQEGGIATFADARRVPIIRADVYNVSGMPIVRGRVVTKTKPSAALESLFGRGVELKISCNFNDNTLRRVN